MPEDLSVYIFGAIIFGYGVVMSNFGIKLFPLGLGFLMVVVGLCWNGRRSGT